MGHAHKKDHHHPPEEWGKVLLGKLVPELGEKELSLSLLIPVYNCSENIGNTLESIQRQNYPHLEVIVIDAGSTDKTLEILGMYQSLITRIYTVTDFNPYEMINRGISLCSGNYITILFPGSHYLCDVACQVMARSALDEGEPEILYCGSIQREAHRSPRVIHQPFDLRLMEQGMHPATLPAVWFRTDLFEKIGRFRSTLTLRSAFEFFCRFVEQNAGRALSVERVYVDFDFGHFTYAKLAKYATDTWVILFTHFGLWKAVRWFLGVNHLNIVRWWFHNLKFKF